MAFPPKSMADFGEFGKLFADLKLPPLPDIEAFVSASRRNIETLTAANRVALEGAQAVARRNTEIVQQNMTELTEAVKALATLDGPQAKAAKQAELLKQGYERAVGNLKEISDLIYSATEEQVVTSAKQESPFGVCEHQRLLPPPRWLDPGTPALPETARAVEYR